VAKEQQVNRERLFKAFADIALLADLEELNWAASKQVYGAETIDRWIKNCDDAGAAVKDDFLVKMLFIEMFLRLANGHSLPKNVGLKEQMDIVYEELGIDPRNTGEYPS
jgi:hypothetical protein